MKSRNLFCNNRFQNFFFVLVCGADDQLESNGYYNHKSCEKPVAGLIGAAGEIPVNIAQWRSKAQSQRVCGVEDAQNLGVGGCTEQIIGNQRDHNGFQGHGDSSQNGSGHGTYHADGGVLQCGF